MTERTPYQDKIIKRYYENKDAIMYQKLSEMVTELYLAEGKKRLSIWKRAAKALENMGVPADKAAQLAAKDDPVLLAKFLEKKA